MQMNGMDHLTLCGVQTSVCNYLTVHVTCAYLGQQALGFVNNRKHGRLQLGLDVGQLELVDGHSRHAGKVELRLLGHWNLQLGQLQCCQVLGLHLHHAGVDGVLLQLDVSQA